jgi:hypothetical protein
MFVAPYDFVGQFLNSYHNEKITNEANGKFAGGALPTIKIKDQSDYSCTEGYLAVAASLAGAPVPYNMVQKGLSCMGSWFN